MSSMRKRCSPSIRRSKGGLIDPEPIKTSLAPSSIDPFDMNITKYIQNSDISMAKNVGVWVRKIILPCAYIENPSEKLYLSFLAWMNNNDVLLHVEEKVDTSEYGDRDYETVYYFNRFKVYTHRDGRLDHFAFGELDNNEIQILKENGILYDRNEYDSHKDLDMLRIAYGIAKKYPKLLEVKNAYFAESGIFGIVPKLIEPTAQQLQERKNRLKKWSGK